MAVKSDIVNMMGEVMTITTLPGESDTLLLVDSGACISTCPREWCAWQSLHNGRLPTAVTATDSALVLYGTWRLRRTTSFRKTFELDFIVSNVTRPIIVDKDMIFLEFIPDLTTPASLVRLGLRLPLVVVGML
eukprot:16435761-Heterocapsa_arctica.AAC.1